MRPGNFRFRRLRAHLCLWRSEERREPQACTSLSHLRIRFVALCVGLDTGVETRCGDPAALHALAGMPRCYIFEAQTVTDQKHQAPQMLSCVMPCVASN
jgi:hypothetical protein